MKFKVGDKVIGNSDNYGVTCKGWIGKVVDVSMDGKSFTAFGVNPSGFGQDFHCLAVADFDLYEAKDAEKLEYKVGDRVIAYGNIPGYENKPGTIVSINKNFRNPYCVEYDHRENSRIWSRIVSRIEDVKKIVITVDGRTTLARLYKDGKVVKSAKARCCLEDTFDFKVGADIAYCRLMDKPVELPPTYKPGDKVRVVKNTCCHYSEIGEIITLTKTVGRRMRDKSFKWEYTHDNGKKSPGWIVESDVERYEAPKYYNGKVVCTRCDMKGEFTVGKIYTFVDGTVKDNNGRIRYEELRIKHPSVITNIYGFIPFVE